MTARRRWEWGGCTVGLALLLAACGSAAPDASTVPVRTPAASGSFTYRPLPSETPSVVPVPSSTPTRPAPVHIGTTVRAGTKLADLEMTLVKLRDPAGRVISGSVAAKPDAGHRFVGLVFAFRTLRADPGVATGSRILLFGSDGQRYSPNIGLQIPGCGDASPQTTKVAATGQTTKVCLAFQLPAATKVQRVQFLEPLAPAGRLTPVAEWVIP